MDVCVQTLETVVQKSVERISWALYGSITFQLKSQLPMAYAGNERWEVWKGERDLGESQVGDSPREDVRRWTHGT